MSAAAEKAEKDPATGNASKGSDRNPANRFYLDESTGKLVKAGGANDCVVTTAITDCALGVAMKAAASGELVSVLLSTPAVKRPPNS